jgi:hypothetical protein
VPLCPEARHIVDELRADQQIGADVHHFFIRHYPHEEIICESVDGIADLEHQFLSWRRRNPIQAYFASIEAARAFRPAVLSLAERMHGVLMRAQVPFLLPSAISYIDARIDLFDRIGVIRRSGARASADLNSLDHTAIDHLVHEEAARQHQQRMAAAQEVGRVVVEFDQLLARMQQIAQPLELLIENGGNPMKRHARWRRTKLRQRRQLQRKAFWRSFIFFSEFYGSAAARDFIRGKPIRIEGEKGIFEVKRRTDSILEVDGDAVLWLYDKDGSTELCGLCLHTRGTPVLDHVAGILMRIAGGDEDKLLAAANCYSVRNAAYEKDWLVPKLPDRSVQMTLPMETFEAEMRAARVEDRMFDLITAEDRSRLMREICRFLWDRVGDVAPVLPAPLRFTRAANGIMIGPARAMPTGWVRETVHLAA